jgi:hypothetical protein
LQGNVSTVPQIPVESLNLALGFRSVELAQAVHETVVTRDVPQSLMEPMLALAVGVPLHHYGFHVVVEHLAGNPTEKGKRRLIAFSSQPAHDDAVGCSASN